MNLRRQVSSALLKRGYICDGYRMHLKRLTDDLSWVVDTGPLRGRGSDDVDPFVGIRSDRLEEIITRLLDIPSDNWSASVGDYAGRILGEARTWTHTSQLSDVLSAIDLAQERLLPYLHIEKLPGVWDLTSRVGDPAWRDREIAILLLLGKVDAIPERLEAARAEACRYDDEVCEQFKGFEKRVLQHLRNAISQKS